MDRRDDRRSATVETIKGDTFGAFDDVETRVTSGSDRVQRAIRGEDIPYTADCDRAARDERDDEGGI